MPGWLDDLWWTYQSVVDQVGLNGLLALSMYLVLATGQLSLGSAAFMGLGAYAGALLSLQTGWPLLAVLPAACLPPALFALLIGPPTLRLSGVYLAIATIGLGEVLRALYNNLDVLGGALGLSGIASRGSTGLIYSILAAVLAVLWLIQRSGIGRAMAATRQDAVAAEVAGIAVRRLRLQALVASAALAGLAGALAADRTGFIGPAEFGFEPAVAILSFALLGGIESPAGPVLGAAVLTILPEALRGVADLRMVLNGLVIVAAVLFLPRGLLPWRPRRA